MMLVFAKLCCHLLETVIYSKSNQKSKCKRVQYLYGQFPSIGGLTSGPGQGVSRTTGNPVDFLALQRSHQSWPLDGVSGPVS